MRACPRPASIGGIFGLCLGGSIISLVEFVYYFTFKIYAALQQRRQHVRLTSRRLDELKRQRNRRMAHLLRLRRPANGVKCADDGGEWRREKNGVLEISVVAPAVMMPATTVNKQSVLNTEKLFRV